VANKRRVKVKCPRCGYVWRYGGNSEWIICCPKCHTTMSLPRAIIRARGQPLTSPNRR